MLQPKKQKFRKEFRGKRRGVATRRNTVAFGEFGLKSLEAAWITNRQIEAARRAMTHYTKRGGRIWIRIFPNKPITKKPLEVRMGSGKGDVYMHAAVVKPGMMLFEMAAVDKVVAKEAMRLAAHKLPVKTVFVEKHEIN